MLHYDKVQTIEGVTVYGDDEQEDVFYILPDSPRFRLDENGKPVFKFLKYRTPIERGENVKKGGFCNFDVEFVVTPEKEQAVITALKDQLKAQRGKDAIVKIGKLSYTDGTAKLLITDQNNKLVEKIQNPGKPSLYGKNITSFSLELSQDGAPVFEKSLQGGGGFVQVAYTLKTWARLQGATVKFTVDSHTKHTFLDEVTRTEGEGIWREGKYDEKLKDIINRNEKNFIEIKFGNIPEEAKKALRDWAQDELANLVVRKIEVAKAVPDSERGNRATGGTQKKSTTDILQQEDFEIVQTYNENTAISWEILPNGTLPNITTLPGWKDEDSKQYFHTIDADDPFFRTLQVTSRVNADFTNMPIYNVTVEVNYDKPASFVIKTADETKTYTRFLKADGTREYTYFYTVNYKGSAKTLKSDPIKSQSSDLTISVDDLGLLLVDVKADATLDFNKVDSVMVSYRYEDAGQKIQRIERSFVLDNTTKTYSIREVLGVPRTKPYQYQVEYRMKGGQRFLKSWQSSESPQLFIGSPFSETKSYKMMGRGYSTIQEMYVDLKYEETGNNYRQTRSVALKQDVTPDAWEVPVIDPKGGKLTYSGTMVKKDGTTEEIPTTEHSVDKTVIVVGKPDIQAEKLSVTVYPDLIKWDDKLKLVQVNLKYEDTANNISAEKTINFKSNVTQSVKWEVDLKDKTKKTFQWKATFHSDPPQSTEWQSTTDTDIYPKNLAWAAPEIQAEKLSVTVYPELIKWDDKLKLVQVNLKYEDPANKVSEQKTINFKKEATQSVKWEVDLKDKTKKTFQWKATFHSDSPHNSEWQSTTDTDVYPENPVAAAPQIQAGKLTVTVYPDLIEWDDKLKLVQVNLKYEDTANNVLAEKTINFKKDIKEPVKWEVDLKDKTKKTFQWKATFRSDRPRSDGWQSTTDTDVYIENPAAAASA
jgi:hypothetical protein